MNESTFSDFWIPLADGTHLAARRWCSSDAQAPAPVLLEYLPYRLADGTHAVDPILHGYFAAAGYVSVRVDIRGSGDAEGLLTDEYSRDELADGVQVISWLAKQPWCSGQVGMFGISWGGFNALQIAALRPPALGAVITACSTDDRYHDDVHYVGGCIQALDVLVWPTQLTSFQARPPSNLRRSDWRQQWLKRLDAMPHFAALWLEHQRRDSYWRHGSVIEDYSAIQCPVFVVGGWSDGYKNSLLRLLAGLRVPRRGLIGPWAHGWPNLVTPEPRIGFLHECVRWWDRHLRQRDNGIDEEPMLRIWQQEFVAPETSHRQRPGRWIAESVWPPPNERIKARQWQATASMLLRGEEVAATAAPALKLSIGTDLHQGQDAGAWCPFGFRRDHAQDQRDANGFALCFETAPVNEAQGILGHPEIHVRLRVDQPVAQLIVRLNDVAADGRALLVSRGAINLTHRRSHSHPEVIAVGEELTVQLRLDACCHRLLPDHRWLVAVSPSYWPMLWPAPVPVRMEIIDLNLILPMRSASHEDTALPEFSQPELGPAVTSMTLTQGSSERQISEADNELVIEAISHSGRIRLADGLEQEHWNQDRWQVHMGNPANARVECVRETEQSRADWKIRIVVEASMASRSTHFCLNQKVRAFEKEKLVFERNWEAKIERDLV